MEYYSSMGYHFQSLINDFHQRWIILFDVNIFYEYTDWILFQSNSDSSNEITGMCDLYRQLDVI